MPSMVLADFHPIVARWFASRFAAPTPAQERGWPAIRAGRDTLIAAPTGSGKTLAAFLACLDDLVGGAAAGALEERARVLYVSPLKALGNDVRKNLEEPLAEMRAQAEEDGTPLPPIRVAVRSGDTSPAQRQAMIRRPPHVLITTPESLYLLLTARSGRAILKTIRTVIVDEIHAVAQDKRGAHLSLSLERLDALVTREGAPRPLRIGLSATQRPVEEIGRFLVGTGRVAVGGAPDCAIVDEGHRRALDLGIEIPEEELCAVASKEQWADVHDRIAALVEQHRTTLVFVSTRRLVERVSHALGERLGEERVAAHHGSLSQATRLRAEERLKRAEVRCVVATASLELGIDVGAVELVCQIGSPRSFAVGLQRIGRSGHFRGGVPKGRLFPLTRDELLECAAFVRGVRAGRLEETRVRRHPLDVLAQQIVAMAASEEEGIREDDLLRRVREAWPYRDLPHTELEQVIAMLAEGVGTRRGRSGAHLHRDGVNHVLHARRGARIAALTSGGAIPDTAQYAVVQEPEGLTVGTLDEDFAIESMAGDVFLLGNTSWRILRVEAGRVRVADAQGAPPSVPFWNGEAPGRSADLSEEVGRLRAAIEPMLDEPPRAIRWLEDEAAVPPAAGTQMAAYLAAGRAALGALPTQDTLIAERFFDEAGGMQLVLHAPFGQRVNRAFGLALRKRFCRSFDFELQAAASDDGVLLSLGPQHSFPLESVFDFLHPETVKEVLEQAVLGAPMFGVRWRWNATRALAILRQQGGRRVPAPIQRMKADDLVAAVFPAQAACQENVTYPIEIPDHPLVNETMRDCLGEAMDLEGLIALLRRIQGRAVRLLARDTPEPSPLAHELLGSHPYTYLDDAPLEERRARAVATRRSVLPEKAGDLGALDPAAIAEVAEQAWPDARDAEEVHDALLSLWALPDGEVPAAWRAHLETLAAGSRALRVERDGGVAWVAAERATKLAGMTADEAARVQVGGWMQCLGPVTAEALARRLAIATSGVEAALLALESEGMVLRGRFTPGLAAGEMQWCDRVLLARIHRQTLGRLRREIEPVASADLVRFLGRWQHVHPGTRLHGTQGVAEVIEQLQGLQLPAGAWEREVLPARVEGYEPWMLDELCLGGDVAWGRLAVPAARISLGVSRGSCTRDKGEPETAEAVGGQAEGSRSPARRAGPTRNAPIALVLRDHLPWLLEATDAPRETLGPGAQDLLDVLRRRGAMFLGELQAVTRRLPSELEQALWELVSAGMVTSDGFAGLRRLVSPARRSGRTAPPWRRIRAAPGAGGRWSLLRPEAADDEAERGMDSTDPPAWLEPLARQYLRRWGVVFRDLLARETRPPPWRELVPVYRRLEARGEIRGGRFVGGYAGEQFALPEAVDALRTARRNGRDGTAGERLDLCAADPLNLIGILDPGPRMAAVLGRRIVYVDGAPQKEGGERPAFSGRHEPPKYQAES